MNLTPLTPPPLVWISSPEGSYTEDTSQEHHTPHHRSTPPQPGHPHSDPHEFDDEFDDDDPLPVIGHCKALYSFDGEGSPCKSVSSSRRSRWVVEGRTF